MIQFINVTKTYENKAVGIEDVNVNVKPGEFVSLVGRSGAGKSTFIKLLTGEERPTKGRILFGSYEVNKLEDSELSQLRRQIGIVFQDFRLLANKTAFENVAFALEVGGRPQSEIEEFVPQVLDMVGLVSKRSHFPHQLSGGEKQRVAIARAMIHHPAVIIADEPTGNLDSKSGAEILKLLGELNKDLKVTVLIVTHDKEIAAQAKRQIQMKDGEIVKS
jgi:cell division transport system ATP-binding protein